MTISLQEVGVRQMGPASRLHPSLVAIVCRHDDSPARADEARRAVADTNRAVSADSSKTRLCPELLVTVSSAAKRFD